MIVRRVVLWGARGDDIQLGSFEDRFRAAYLRMNPTMLHSMSVYRSVKDQRMLQAHFAWTWEERNDSPFVRDMKTMGRMFDMVWPEDPAAWA